MVHSKEELIDVSWRKKHRHLAILVAVTTRITTFLVANSSKPSFATGGGNRPKYAMKNDATLVTIGCSKFIGLIEAANLIQGRPLLAISGGITLVHGLING